VSHDIHGIHGIHGLLGLRTARRISHVYIMDVPTYPKPLMITEAADRVGDPYLHVAPEKVIAVVETNSPDRNSPFKAPDAESEKIASEITDPYRRRKAMAQLKSQQAPIVDFDALFIPDSSRTVRLIAPAIAAEDVITAGCDTKELEVVRRTTKNEQLRTVQLLGTSLWDSADLVDERSGIARYVQCSIFVDVFFPQSDRPATKRFVDEYVNAYHRQPGFLEAHAFDAAGLLKKAIDERHPQTRADLREALSGLKKPFEGAAGDTLFGKDREAQKPFFWLWINRGTIQEFDPEGTPPVPPAAPPAPAKTGGK